MPSKELITTRIARFEKAWTELAAESSFGGMTLEQFIAGTRASFEERQTIQVLEMLRSAAIGRRNAADAVSREKIELMVNGVRSDPDHGPDSPLYRALGYVPKSERRSGLTRKVNSAAATPDPLKEAA